MAQYTNTVKLWQYGLWSFQTGDTILERFLPKKWRAVKKCQNLSFKVNFLCQKSSKSISFFFNEKKIEKDPDDF